MNRKIDEAKLTAFALGELPEDEARELRDEIENSEELRHEVDEIRRVANELTEVFRADEATGLTEQQRACIADEAKVLKPRFGRRVYRYAAVAAAACVLLVVVLEIPPGSFSPFEKQQVLSPAGSGTPLPVEDTETDLPNAQGGEGDDGSDAQPAASAVSGNEMPVVMTGESGSRVDTSTTGIQPEPKKKEQEPVQGLDSSSNTVQYEMALREAANRLKSSGQIPGRSGAAAQGTGPIPVSREAFKGVAGIVGGVLGPAAASPPVAPSAAPSWDGRMMMDEARPMEALRRQSEFNTEAYDRIVENAFLRVSDHPLSTFSIDVDTASYSNVRRFLNDRMLPPKDAVRIEEMVNYFTYDYAPPSGEHPFAVHIETARAPWNDRHLLVRFGLKGREIDLASRPAGNFVFLADVSGSMQPENKLPLLKKALKLLVDQLNEGDRVSLVVYAGASGVVLPSTPCSQKEQILQALERLEAGGSTNGGEGIQLAYQIAEANKIDGGINRVILATDGDFNVGVTNQGDLTRLIEEKAKSGVFLTVLGFGMGNLKDSTMEKLADKGNGNYAYVDSLQEARKVLVEQVGGTLVTIAKDVKIQVEFNPAQVNAYRLVGYENRLLRDEDFNDDTKDAGEIGAGHTVTVLYEVVPAGVEVDLPPGIDPLKYQKPERSTASTGGSGELLTLKLRYKKPDAETSRLIEVPLKNGNRSFQQASADFRFAASVAGFGMVLRESQYRNGLTLDRVIEIAGASLGKDKGGYRAEFINLARKARAIRDLESLETPDR